jgi:hypothetical protein
MRWVRVNGAQPLASDSIGAEGADTVMTGFLHFSPNLL